MSNYICPKCRSSNTRVKGYIRHAGKAAGELTKIPLVDELGKYLGKKVDKHMIGQYKCESCGHKFFP